MIDGVKIGDVTYTISEVEALRRAEDDAVLYGRIEHMKLKIEVESTLAEPIKRVTLMHEIVHGIFNQAGQDLEDSREELVLALGYGLTALLRNNPALVAYLTEDTAVHLDEVIGDETSSAVHSLPADQQHTRSVG